MNEEEEECVSDHTRSLLKSLRACEILMAKRKNVTITRPEPALQPQQDQDLCHIDDIAMESISAKEFRARYIDANRPCLLSKAEKYFAHATSLWTHAGEDGTRIIHSDWFSQHVLSPVPVRIHNNGLLDSTGRATECETRMMTMNDWIDYLAQSDKKNDDGTAMYLKDWHLQLSLEQQQRDEGSTETSLLYTIPPLFPHDLLNTFLNDHDMGDYRFVYWGPAGSTTPLHSDVMNSFSWSYNVAGAKQWTFFFDNDNAVVVHQKQGDLMFVPSGLKHAVVNLEETLSVNHNWIATAIVDKVWQCVEEENKAVAAELAKWSIAEQMDAQENMLRGCLGLDVTTFFFMILSEGLNDDDAISLMQICQALKILLDGGTDGTIRLQDRLEAQLASAKEAETAISLARMFLSSVH